MSQKTKDNTLKTHAVRIMEEAGSFAFTREYLKKVEEDAKMEIERIGVNPLLRGILKYLSKDYQ